MAVGFNGISDRLFLSASSETLVRHDRPYTICSWVNSGSTGAGLRWVTAQGSQFGSVARLGRDGSSWTCMHRDGSGEISISGGTVTAGKWTHICTRWNGFSEFELIVDGLSVATGAATDMDTFRPGTRSSYGYSFDGDHEFWDGSLTDCSIWQDHLSLAETRQFSSLLSRPSRSGTRQSIYHLRLDTRWGFPHHRSRCVTPAVFTQDSGITVVPGPPFVPTTLSSLVLLHRRRYFTPHRVGRI